MRVAVAAILIVECVVDRMFALEQFSAQRGVASISLARPSDLSGLAPYEAQRSRILFLISTALLWHLAGLSSIV